jgi:DnaJ-domain-containing protein 1
MDKNEIVRKYKRLKMLFLLPVPLFLVFVIFDLLCRSDLYRVLDDIMLAIVIFPFLYFMILPFLGLFIGFLIFILEKKCGMTEKEIKEVVSMQNKKREFLGRNPVKYAFPFIREICKLNKGAKEAQEAILSDFLSKKEIEIIFDDFRKLGSLEDAILCWRKRSLPERLSFMRFLFKLTILQDGIHNDEWNMLMNLIWQLRFSNYYREDFRYRYFSLRTEFYDYERKNSSSTEDNSASTNNRSSSLKPYFTLLGLEETASDEEIKRAYHNLALQHHPDMPKNADRIKECEAMMAKINEAYEKLRG